MMDEKHWAGFHDFVWMERLAGGPSANIKVMASLAISLGLPRDDLRWLCGCYAAIYNSPSAYALFKLFPLESTLKASEEELTAALTLVWQSLPVHSNRRRTCGLPRKLAASMKSLAVWAHNDKPVAPGYGALWEDVNSINTVGRYFGIKLAGIMDQVGLTDARQYDIRAKGAKNGRKSLGYLFPAEVDVADHHNNRKEVLARAEELANYVMGALVDNELEVSWFELEALLCEYNQCVKGKRYPGKTSDADLAATRLAAHGPISMDPVFWARNAKHARYALGEQMGWGGKREELLKVYSELGYMWSDAIYDYSLTTDLTSPVVKDEVLFDKTMTKPGGTK